MSRYGTPRAPGACTQVVPTLAQEAGTSTLTPTDSAWACLPWAYPSRVPWWRGGSGGRRSPTLRVPISTVEPIALDSPDQIADEMGAPPGSYPALHVLGIDWDFAHHTGRARTGADAGVPGRQRQGPERQRRPDVGDEGALIVAARAASDGELSMTGRPLPSHSDSKVRASNPCRSSAARSSAHGCRRDPSAADELGQRAR